MLASMLALEEIYAAIVTFLFFCIIIFPPHTIESRVKNLLTGGEYKCERLNGITI